jgi:hypothetical protein
MAGAVGVLGGGKNRHLERKAAGFPDAGLHLFGQFAQMAVAGRQVRPGVQNADHRAAIEEVVRVALIFQPAAMIDVVARRATIPFLRPKLAGPFGRHKGHDDPPDDFAVPAPKAPRTDVASSSFADTKRKRGISVKSSMQIV